MSYDYASSYGRNAIPVGAVPYDPSQYTGLEYNSVQDAYATPPATSVSEFNTEYYGYGASLGNESAYTATSKSNPQQDADHLTNRPTNYGEYKATLKRKFLDLGANRYKKPEAVAEYDEFGKLAMFVGRDPSYPDELNKIIHPAQCDLCNMKMNSLTSAKNHYESKTHDKNITQWLTKNFTDKGLPIPEVQRFYKQGPAGPDAFYCEYCDLKLTSLIYAEQHYAGKRHRMVVSQRSKPSGEGYYNNEGKWVRISSKLVPKNESRFGIGEQFKYAEIIAKTETSTTTCPDTTTEIGQCKPDLCEPKPAKRPKVNEDDPTLFCAVCRLSVTSALQMTMHLSGSKHQKKLKASGIEVTNTGHAPSSSTEDPAVTTTDNVLNSVIKEHKPDPTDLSMYRTPSGQYYCQSCNLTITNLHALEQHLSGKRHLKSQIEKKALAALSGRSRQ